MKSYIISYDLRGPETSQNYAKLIQEIKNLGGWANPMRSLWIITSNTESCSSITTKLNPYLDTNDKLLVMETIKSWWSYGLDQEVLNWMHQNI